MPCSSSTKRIFPKFTASIKVLKLPQPFFATCWLVFWVAVDLTVALHDLHFEVCCAWCWDWPVIVCLRGCPPHFIVVVQCLLASCCIVSMSTLNFSTTPGGSGNPSWGETCRGVVLLVLRHMIFFYFISLLSFLRGHVCQNAAASERDS